MSQFRVIAQRGSGGFGVVNEVSRVADDGVSVLQDGLAMKTLKAEHAADPEVLARFVREVRLQDELDHPNVVKIVGRNLSADPPYFLMPLAEANLRERLAAQGADRREWVVRVFVGVLDGVAHAHSRTSRAEDGEQLMPVVHRDLKPDNVLFVDGVPKVCDFGLGKRLASGDPSLTRTDVFMGTEPYAAPEQFSSAKHVGPPADVYALGKLLWEMLTGEVPEILHVELDEVPQEFRWFIAKCTRRRADERYRDAGEALAAFRVFISAPEFFGPPMEGVERHVAAWAASADEHQRRDAIKALDDHLQRYSEEEELYFKAVPRLPEELVDLYATMLPEPFAAMLAHYDRHISGSLPFAYCDVVADFYARLWGATQSLDLRRVLLARLIEMGAAHNRWYVGEVVGRLLGGIDDVSTASVAAEVVRDNPRHAEWFWSWASGHTLMEPLAAAFGEITGPNS